MATQIGKGQIFSLSGGSLEIASLVGYVSPNLQTLRVSATGTADRIRGQDGAVNAVIYSDDIIECEFEFIPQGSNIANSKLSAGLPAVGSGVTIAGLPVIRIAGIADALNSDDWVYEGGGTINGSNTEKWTATLPLVRYPGITSTTAIT